MAYLVVRPLYPAPASSFQKERVKKKEICGSTHELSLLAVASFALVSLSVREIAQETYYHDSGNLLVCGHGGNRWRQDRHHEVGQIREEEKRVINSVKVNRFVPSP